jgi:MFS family permease
MDPTPLFRPITGGLLLGLSIGAWIPSYNKIVALVFRARLGEAYASVNSLRMLSGAPSPLVGGSIYEALGAPLVFLSSIAMLAAAALLSLGIQVEPRGTSQEPSVGRPRGR